MDCSYSQRTLRHLKKNSCGIGSRPLVAVIADGSTGFGRGIVRGAMRYVNLKRRWLIHAELSLRDAPQAGWPGFDGLIVAGLSDARRQEVVSCSKRTVICSGTSDPKSHPVASLDDYAVGVMAAEHLLECRLKRFAFYGLAGIGTSMNRFTGFKDTVERAGCVCLDIGLGWLRPGAVFEKAHLAELVEWLQKVEKPIGIMAVDDSAAHGLAAACLEADIAVPDHVAIIGVNNDDLLCESTWPPISSVDGDYSRVGYAAAAMLDRLMQGEILRGKDRAVRLAPQRVVRRQSTDMLAITDPNVLDAVRYIREHACDPCTVPDVLEHVPVTRRWLERHFATIVGRGPYDEILRVRVETAKRLLLEPELKLEDVSSRCGFSIVQQFGRAFRRATGSTPGAYRQSRLLAKG